MDIIKVQAESNYTLLNISEIVSVTLMAPFVNLHTVFSLSSISGQFLLQGIKMLNTHD